MTNSKESRTPLQIVIDILLKVGTLVLLAFWCYRMIHPFTNVLIWGIVIAVTVYPFFNKLETKMGGRKKLAAALTSVLLLLLLVIPAFFLADSMIAGVKEIRAGLGENGIEIPPPHEKISDLPVIGGWLYDTWLSASESLKPLFQKYREQLVSAGQWLLNFLLGTGLGLLQLIISILLAGILLNYADKLQPYTLRLFKKIIGSRGEEFLEITEHTIRNISKGVLGVAIIQSLLLGIIFFAAGVPYAGLWALICLILSIIQVGPFIVTVPIIIYLFVQLEPVGAIIWTVAILAASFVDNILKPVLMGKGASVPMLVIFLGAIGGMIAGGFIGLFIGAVVISLGYKIFLTWLAE